MMLAVDHCNLNFKTSCEQQIKTDNKRVHHMKDFNPTLTRVEYPIEAKYVRKKRTYPFFLRKVAPKEEYVRNVFTNKGITQKLKSPTRKRQHSTLQVPTKENESKSAVEMFLKTLFTGNGNGLNAKNVLPFFSKTRSSTRTPIHATYRNLSVIEKRNEETRVWQLKCRQPGTQRSSRSRQVRTESDVLLVGWQIDKVNQEAEDNFQSKW